MSTSIPQTEEDVKQEECAIEWCHEPIFREGFCWQHFMEEKLAEWDAQDAERRMQLNSTGCYLFGDPEYALDLAWYGYRKEEVLS